MNKELYVTSTPHKTKVGIVEDDQLAEVYLELENEYTLAGSIYKGRVTRVLPGMQSAFVDIGLERDAFLYGSDFMDLEQQDEDLDEAIPAGRSGAEARPQRTSEAIPTNGGSTFTPREATSAAAEAERSDGASDGTGDENGNRDRGLRGRRRRRGRRGERPERGGERTERPERTERSSPETRLQKPPAREPRTGRDYDYGPPPGYQPILLPGESISKYRQKAPSTLSRAEARQEETPAAASIAGTFRD